MHGKIAYPYVEFVGLLTNGSYQLPGIAYIRYN